MKINIQIINDMMEEVGEPIVYEHSNKGMCTRFLHKWAKDYILGERTKENTDSVRYFHALKRNARGIVLWITTSDPRYKMEDIRCISTNRNRNPYCEKYSKIPGSVCEYCYAAAQLRFKKGLAKWLSWNYTVLNMGILSKEDLPVLSDAKIRLESDGDVGSEYATENFANMSKKNKRTQFTAFTKNRFLYDATFDRIGKPNNMILVESGLMLNKDINRGRYADRTFIVCDDKRHSNCAGVKCKTCKISCYSKKRVKNVPVVYETLRLSGNKIKIKG